ncbi:MAG: ATP-binding protein [Desulfuromonadaceae bacterium]|nr:ATP-binding protein [Desulfuromonadaceae bacterium]MDD5105234.1 ATP-binding protein [Desulfuromonadaceae bacterium]
MNLNLAGSALEGNYIMYGTDENETGKLILIVEDSLVQTEVLNRKLSREGYRVVVAHNGAKGLELARTLSPALILSDIVMPVMDGYRMCREIKDTPFLKEVPVVLLTQLYEPEEIIRGLESGADAYMTKTVCDDLFMAKVQALLNNPVQFRNHSDLKCTSFEYEHKHYEVHSDRAQTLSFLISTYENAVWQNRELNKVQNQLRTLNEMLEETIEKRTRELTNEIAERKKAEDDLRESELRFRTIFETNTDGLITLRIEDNKFYMCNRAICRMLGYSEDELLRLGIADIHPKDELPHVISQFERQVKGEISVVEDLLVKRKDGSVIYADVNTSPITLDGKPHIIGAFRDVTDRKKLQESEVARLAAEEGSRAKSDFLANMSHELRTPLNSVIGFSEVLQDDLCGPLNEKQREYVGNILISGRHLLSLINDILDLSKVESGKMELELSVFSLRESLNDSLMMFSEKSLNGGVNIHLKLSPEADVTITADQRKLKQIMFNLLSNAVKFTPAGGSVSVQARMMRVEGREMREEHPGLTQPSSLISHPSSDSHQDFIEISVTDTGIGIRAENIPKLFQPFSQLEPVYTREFKGTGLGLALTRRLVELHGGTVQVESQFGRGSRFSFTLPLKQRAV